MIGRELRTGAWGTTALFMLSLVACGGGGGGDKYPNLNYTGVTSQASVTESNASDYPRAVIEGEDSAELADPTLASIQIDGTARRTAELSDMTVKEIRRQLLDRIGASNNNGDSLIGASYSQSGDCGGSVSANENVGSSSFSGSVTYSDFCTTLDPYTGARLTLHGKIKYSGTFDGSQYDPIIRSLNISFVYLKVAYRDDYETYSDDFSGDLRFTYDATGYNIASATVTVRWEYNGAVYQLSDDGTTQKLYHPVHGWVSFESNVTYGSCSNGLPDGGTMTIMGRDGGAEFRFSGTCTEYVMCLVADSSGTVDESSCKPVSWE